MRPWLLLALLIGTPALADPEDVRLEQAIRLDPGNVHLRLAYAKALGQGEADPQIVEEAWKEVLKLDPRQVEAYMGLGGLYEANEQLKEAVQAFEKVVELDPLLEAGYLRLATLTHYQVEHPGAAEAILRRCLAQVPEAYGARLQLGDILLEKGDWEGARKVFDAAKNLKPAATEPWAGLMAVAAGMGKRDQWTLIWEGWKKAVEPLEVGDLFFRGAQKMPEGQDAVKETLLKRAISLSPQAKGPYSSLVVVLNNQRRDGDLHRLYQEMMARFPDDPLAYSQLGMWHMDKERYADAERLFVQLVEKAPDDPFSYLSLTEALVKQGKKADARRWLRQGLQMLPGDPILQDALRGL